MQRKNAGVGNALADIVSLGYRIPAWGAKKTVGFVGDFGSRLTNNVTGDISKATAGFSSGPARWAPPREVMQEDIPDIIKHVSKGIGGYKKLNAKDTLDGASDLYASVKGISEEANGILNSPIASRLAGKDKINVKHIAAAGLGGAGVGVALNKYNEEQKKEAGLLSLKSKVKLLTRTKPKMKDMALGIGVGAAGALAANAAENHKTAGLFDSIGSAIGTAAGKIRYAIPKMRASAGGMRESMLNAFKDQAPAPAWGKDLAGRAAAKQKNNVLNQARIDRQAKPRAERYAEMAGRFGKDPAKLQRVALMGAKDFISTITPSSPWGKAGLVAAPFVAPHLMNFVKGQMQNRAMMNAIKTYAPPVALGTGAYMMMRNNNEKRAAALYPIRNPFKYIARKLRKEVVDLKDLARTKVKYDDRGNIQRVDGTGKVKRYNTIKVYDEDAGKLIHIKNDDATIKNIGYVKAISLKANDAKAKYGPTLTAGLVGAKVIGNAYKVVRNAHAERQAAKADARDLKILAGLGAGGAATILGIDAYNAQNKYASKVSPSVIKGIIAKTPRAGNIEDAISHWGSKREMQVAALDDLGERNLFNAFKHDRATRALNEAEESLYNLQGATNGVEEAMSSAAAPTVTSGMTAKGVAVGAGAGVLGTAAYIKKKQNEEAAAAQQYYSGN